jgi:SEC-C motif-containing protein
MESKSAVTPLPVPQRGQPCPCGSGQPFESCCGPALDGSRPAPTAEALMRSRFTAHVARDDAYLHRTYRGTAGTPFVPDPKTEPMDWTRLVVHAHEPGATPDQAFVDFTAYFAAEGAEHAIHEKSAFERTNGQWIYTRAVRSGPAPVRAAAKVGRNDPCPCGSGKKYKHCHGAK